MTTGCASTNTYMATVSLLIEQDVIDPISKVPAVYKAEVEKVSKPGDLVPRGFLARNICKDFTENS